MSSRHGIPFKEIRCIPWICDTIFPDNGKWMDVYLGKHFLRTQGDAYRTVYLQASDGCLRLCCNIPSEKVVGWMSLEQHTDKDSQLNASYLLQQKPWKGGCHWCLSFLDGPILEEDVMSMIFTVRDHMKR